MSSVDQQLQEHLAELKRGKIHCFPATVKSIDKDTNTLTVVDGLDLEYPDVRLTATNGGTDALVCYPAVDSSVLVLIINDQENELLAIAYEKVEELKVKVENVNVLVDKDGIKLNGDQFSVVKAEDLKAVMDQNKAFIDAFKQLLSSPITEPGNGSPSAFQAALNAALSPMQWGDHSQIANEKVKHA